MEIDEISRELVMEDLPQHKLTPDLVDVDSDDAADCIIEFPKDRASAFSPR